MKFINLTPHVIKVCAEAFPTGWAPVLILGPSGQVARCSVAMEERKRLSHFRDEEEYGPFPVYWARKGKVTGLPAEDDDTGYIVSTLVREAEPDRTDLFSPGELIRGEDGQPIGCKGLVCN